MIGLLYSGIECVIEGHRGRHDVYNSFYTGALTGGLLARGSAPPSPSSCLSHRTYSYARFWMQSCPCDSTVMSGSSPHVQCFAR